MKTKIAILFLLALPLVGCSQPKQEYISSSHVTALYRYFMPSMGEKVDNDLLSKAYVRENEGTGAYYIKCERTCTYMVGKGDYAQLLFVDEIGFSISKDSTINSLFAVWTNSMNDIINAKYQIKKALGEPTSINPVNWTFGKYSLTLISDRSSYSKDIHFVDVEIDKD